MSFFLGILFCYFATGLLFLVSMARDGVFAEFEQPLVLAVLALLAWPFVLFVDDKA